MSKITNKIDKASLEEFKELRDAEWELTRELARKDLWFLLTEVLWPDKAFYHYQESLHRPIADWVTTGAKHGCRKLLLMPRRHRKSYIANITKCVHLILNDPNIRILVVCSNFGLAQEFLGVIKRVFQYNEGIKKYFPEFHVPPDQQFGTKLELTHPLRTAYELADPTIRAAYLGAPLAGRRCDVLICDDPIEKSHVTTPEQADKALANFNDLIPLVDDTPNYSQIFVIGTRWAFNDVYAALLGESRGDEQKVEVSEARRYESIVRHCLENEKGEPDILTGTPIFPQRFTKASLLDILEEYKNDPKRGEEDFFKQMMNVCMSPKGMKFLYEWGDNWVDKLPANIVWSGIALDSATKDEQVIMRGDYTAAHVGHFDAYGHLYLTNAIHSDELKSPDLMRQLIMLSQYQAPAQNGPVTNIVKEKVGEEMFFGMVREAYSSANMPITLYPCNIRGQGKKVVRVVEGLQAPFMSGKIHFVKGYPKHIHRLFMDELTHIGQWAHDDLADAASLFFHKDVRVRPPSFQNYEWKSTATKLGGRLGGGNPSNWKMKNINNGDNDGTLRGDPFLSDRYGEDTMIHVGNVGSTYSVTPDGNVTGFKFKR